MHAGSCQSNSFDYFDNRNKKTLRRVGPLYGVSLFFTATARSAGNENPLSFIAFRAKQSTGKLHYSKFENGVDTNTMLPLHYYHTINDITSSSNNNNNEQHHQLPQKVTKPTSTMSSSSSSSSETTSTTMASTAAPPLQSFMFQLMLDHNVHADGPESIRIINDNAKRCGPLNQNTRRSLQQQLDISATKCCKDDEHRRHRWESGCSAAGSSIPTSPTDTSTPPSPSSPMKVVATTSPVVLKLGKDMPLSSPIRLRREGSITSGVPSLAPSSPIQFSTINIRKTLQRPRSPTPSNFPWMMKDISSSSSSSSLSPKVTIQRKC